MHFVVVTRLGPPPCSPYRGLQPTPTARAEDLNRLRTYLDTWMRRHHQASLTAVHVWHSEETGENPHAHVFMHCPHRLRDELNRALVGLYPAGVIDVREGGDIRRLHSSGFFGSTLDYMMRFKSQQAFVAAGGKAWRASVKVTALDAKTGRSRTINRGIKSPITGKRWGCTRNISPRATGLYLEATSAARAQAKAA